MSTTTSMTYSSTQVCAETGLTFRQLDYWTRQGAITPQVEARGSGSRRRWSQEAVDALSVVARVLDAVPAITSASLVETIFLAAMSGDNFVVLDNGVAITWV